MMLRCEADPDLAGRQIDLRDTSVSDGVPPRWPRFSWADRRPYRGRLMWITTRAAAPELAGRQPPFDPTIESLRLWMRVPRRHHGHPP